MMKKTGFLFTVFVLAGMLAGCGRPADPAAIENVTASDTSVAESTIDASGQDKASEGGQGSDKVASADEMVEPENVVEEGMTPVYGDSLRDGTYDVEVKSSSSMFKISKCELTVAAGKMTAAMTMSGTGYLYLYMGTGEEAVSAAETDYIPFVENEAGEHTYTIPVEALDMAVDCAAFSRKKEKWYDRVLLFKADSLPQDAFLEGAFTILELADGNYTVDVTIAGGSGRASVESPAGITVKNGRSMLTLIWSSSNYDYMVVDGEKYFPVNAEGNSTFEIPVPGFDFKIPVLADTTAMSTPHEIEYTLLLDSSSLKQVEADR